MFLGMKKLPPGFAGPGSAAGSPVSSAGAPSSLPSICTGSLGGSRICTAGTCGMIRGAGGAISDWQGRDPVGAQSIVAAATPELHATAIAALNP